MTALVEGKRVLGSAKEMLEVKNAIKAYEAMKNWEPSSAKDLLVAHKLMMDGLVARPDAYRSRGVGIAQGETLVHLAPSASMIHGLMGDLLRWLKTTDVHPFIASCVFHYELEFIHPFTDGNGRMGRLWQTLILSQWKPSLAYLPVEGVIRQQQQKYCATLAACDKVADSSQFIEFLLAALLQTLRETGGAPSQKNSRVTK